MARQYHTTAHEPSPRHEAEEGMLAPQKSRRRRLHIIASSAEVFTASRYFSHATATGGRSYRRTESADIFIAEGSSPDIDTLSIFHAINIYIAMPFRHILHEGQSS
jgi:hypothetical protein